MILDDNNDSNNASTIVTTRFLLDTTEDDNNIHSHHLLLNIIPKFTAFLSVMGSSMIISQVLRSPMNRRNIQQRIVLGMSMVDFMVSSVWLFTNILMPQWSAMKPALGNHTTCQLQGFLVQFSTSSIMYNSCLTTYYVLIIVFGWSENKVKQQKVEYVFHVLSISFGSGTAIAALVLDLYHPANWDCWIGDCDPSYTLFDGGPSSCHKLDADKFRWAFFFGPLWVVIVYITTAMIVVYCKVHSREKKSLQWTHKNKNNNNNATNEMKHSKKVFRQSLLYIGAFYVTWFWPTITRFIQLVSPKTNIPNWLVVISGSFISLQGFLNSVVYFRPRFLRCSKDNPHLAPYQVMWIIMLNSLFFCFLQNYGAQDGKDIEYNTRNKSNQNSSSCSSRIPTPSEQHPCHDNVQPQQEQQQHQQQDHFYDDTTADKEVLENKGCNNNMLDHATTITTEGEDEEEEENKSHDQHHHDDKKDSNNTGHQLLSSSVTTTAKDKSKTTTKLKTVLLHTNSKELGSEFYFL